MEGTKAGKGPSKAYITAALEELSDSIHDPEEIQEAARAIDLGTFFDEMRVPYERQLQICTGYCTHLRALLGKNKSKQKKRAKTDE